MTGFCGPYTIAVSCKNGVQGSINVLLIFCPQFYFSFNSFAGNGVPRDGETAMS